MIVATLPTAPADKTQILIKLVTQGGTNGVTVNTGGSDVLNKTAGSTSYTLSYLNQTVTLQYKATGAIWTVINTDIPLTATDTRYNGSGQNSITGLYYMSKNGGDPTGVSDSQPAIQALVNSVPYGSTIFLDGFFRINTPIMWKSGVSMKSHHHKSGGILVYCVDTPGIRWNVSVDGATAGAPLVDVVFDNFEIDCLNQTLSGTYAGSQGPKAIVIQYMARSHFRNLYVHDSQASGIGVDYLKDGCTITNNIVINCGRGHPTGAPNSAGGGAGIGIGLATTSNEEPLLISGNFVKGNGTNSAYGIFLESQGSSQTPATSGLRVVNNYCTGNMFGIGDSGARRSVIVGNTVTGNFQGGIGVDNGTIGGTHTSYDGIIEGNQIYNNTGPGILFDYTTAGGKYTVIGNAISFNNQGILIKFAGSVGAGAVYVTKNNIHDNKYTGIRAYYSAAGTGGLTEGEFSANFIYNNGTQGTTGDKDGIRFEVPLTNVKIDSNYCFDRAGTKTQDYGLVLTSAAPMVGGSVCRNDLRNNKTGAANIAASLSATTWIADNAGYAGPAATSVSIGASPYTYTAPDFPSVLTLDGGTVSSVTVAGQVIATGSNRSFLLEASDPVVITHTGAPSATSRAR